MDSVLQLVMVVSWHLASSQVTVTVTSWCFSLVTSLVSEPSTVGDTSTGIEVVMIDSRQVSHALVPVVMVSQMSVVTTSSSEDDVASTGTSGREVFSTVGCSVEVSS